MKSEDDVKPHWWILTTLLLWGVCALAQVADVSRPFEWVPQTYALPPGVRVFAGQAAAPDGSPIRAFYADVDLGAKNLRIAPYLSDDPSGKQPASAIANRVGAIVAINGGYFDVSRRPARTFSLVRRDGANLSENIGRVTRPAIGAGTGSEFFLTRSAVGFLPDGTLSFAWVHQFPDGMRAFDNPNPNAPGAPAPPLEPTAGAPWNPPDAIGGGPRLIQGGQARVTYDEEVFFGSGFGRDNPYPRAAVGLTRDRHLILFATDGKQSEHSVGLSLPLLAQTLQNLDCIEAMNLDGGGSETLVINGVAINKPSDATGERPVTSILAVVPR